MKIANAILQVFEVHIKKSDLLGTKVSDLSDTKIWSTKGKIIKILLDFKIKNIKEINKKNEDSKLKLDQASIEYLAQYCSDSAIEQFIKDNEIDISEFKDTKIPYLLLKDAEPIQEEVSDENSPQEILLSRTYAVDMSKKEEIVKAYTNLLQWDETSKIFYFAAAKIKEGDSLKILFTESCSYYNLNKNLITIQTAEHSMLSIESIMAHEFSHCLIEKLYNNQAMPFSLSALEAAIFHRNIPKTFISNYSLNIKTDNILGEGIEELKNFLGKYLEYEKASIESLKLAASLLDKDNEEILPFTTFKEYVDYFREFTILPLFALRGYESFTEEVRKPMIELIATDPNVQIIMCTTISKILTLDIAKEEDSRIYEKLLQEDINERLKYVLEEFLPLIIKELKISEDSCFFLERIGDIVFRRGDEDKLVEFVVRFPEFAVMQQQGKLENPKIMESFNLLKEFWDKHIISKIDSDIKIFKEDSHIENLPELDTSLVGDHTIESQINAELN